MRKKKNNKKSNLLPTNIPNTIETEDLEEITEMVDLHAYIDVNSAGEEEVHLRVKKDGKFDYGINLGKYLSDKIIPHLDG